MIGSDGDVCDLVTGQCACKANYAGRTCDQCRDGYFNYPDCEDCDCDTRYGPLILHLTRKVDQVELRSFPIEGDQCTRVNAF